METSPIYDCSLTYLQWEEDYALKQVDGIVPEILYICLQPSPSVSPVPCYVGS